MDFWDEPTPQEQAAALAAALRRRQETAQVQRGFGNLGLLTGDRVLSQFGRQQLQGADNAEAQVGQQRQSMLRMAMEAERARQAAQAKTGERDAANAEWDRRNRITAGQADRRARILAGQKEEKEERAKLDKKQSAMTELEERAQAAGRMLDEMEKQIDQTGTFEMFGPENALLEGAITSYAVDMAKLRDPGSVAREADVELEKRSLFNPGVMGIGTSNKTAKALIKAARDRLKARRAEAYQVRGLQPPQDAPAQAPSRGGLTPEEAAEYEALKAELAGAQ